MNIESKLEEINDELKQFQKNVEVTFDRLVTNIQTPEVKEKVKHFKDIKISKISKNILQTIQVIDAPISVGLVGRYSHGKTALINEFFSMDAEYSLPEGEGIVTSKITKVEFDSKVSSPICSQVFRDRRENRISLEALKLSVSTNDTNSELIDYYSIKLPIREDYSKLFESKKINLIDMPGLGGAYFKDSEKTRKYVDNVDMLIVVIKITEIKEAARCIEPYIHNLSIPIIPVLTFFDVWAENPTFITCSNDEEAICKAKELIKDLIPSLSKHEIRTIAVSSKTKHNIRALRESVCNFVEPQNFALQKIKSETPEVFRRRVNEISREINKITVDIENSLSRLEREMQGLIPKSHVPFESFEQFFKKQKDKLTSSSKHEISQCVKDISADFKNIGQEIMSLSTMKEIKEHISKIKEDINSKKLAELNSKIDDLLLNLRAILFDVIDKYIDRLDVDDSTKQEWKESVFEGVENYRSSIDDIVEYKAPSVAAFEVEKIAKDVVDFATGISTNPQIIPALFIVAVFLLVINIPFVGSAIQSVVSLPILILTSCTNA